MGYPMPINEFKTCQKGLELYQQYCLAVELVEQVGLTHEAQRQEYWQVWVDHKNNCPVCAGLKGDVK